MNIHMKKTNASVGSGADAQYFYIQTDTVSAKHTVTFIRDVCVSISSIKQTCFNRNATLISLEECAILSLRYRRNNSTLQKK